MLYIGPHMVRLNKTNESYYSKSHIISLDFHLTLINKVNLLQLDLVLIHFGDGEKKTKLKQPAPQCIINPGTAQSTTEFWSVEIFCPDLRIKLY